MDNGIWIALIATAIGTFLMRMLPLLYLQRHLLRRNDKNAGESIPIWLGVLGPSMIAAMYGTSLVPSASSMSSWMATVLGLILTFLVWKWTKSLGWPILAGVTVYGLVKMVVTAV
jgi:branched-subunit amino acid transport protein